MNDLPDTSPTLSQALRDLGLDLPPEQERLIDAYREELWNWNERLNLTRHTSLKTFVERDVWDAWQVAQLLESGERVLDVGTGGGVPGLLIAILRPDVNMTVCDSIQKKARALQAIVVATQIRARVAGARAEALLNQERFDTLLFRGVGPLWKILRDFRGSWESMGRLLLIKGPRWVEERGEARHRGLLKKPLQLRRLVEYRIGVDGPPSVILQICRENSAYGLK